MAYALTTYAADGDTSEFAVPFPYLDRNHVRVTVNGAVPFRPVVFNNTGMVQVSPTPPEGSIVELRRVTPRTPLVAYNNGAVLTAEDLNTATLQLIYLFQELDDQYNDLIVPRLIATGGGFVTDPDAVVAAIANLVLESAVLSRFREAIADVDLNAQAIINEALSRYGITIDITKLDKGITQVDARVTTEITTRITESTAFAERIDTVTASLVNEGIAIRALVGSVESASVTADTALASRIDDTIALIGDTAAVVTAETTARVAADEAEATARLALAVSLGNTQIALTEESTARIDADGALASIISLIGYEDPGSSAFILDSSTVLIADPVGGSTSNLATTISGLLTRVGNAEADIVFENEARADADSAFASSITLINTQIGGFSASVATLSESIDGLQAKWGVSLTVNGFVSGVVLNNDGASSSFNILADRFAIVDPNSGPGATPQTVFEVVDGLTRIRNLVIGESNVETANITPGATSSATAASGSTSVNCNGLSGGPGENDATAVTLAAPIGRPVVIQGRTSIDYTPGGTPSLLIVKLVAVQSGVTTVIDAYRDTDPPAPFLALHVPTAGSPVTYKFIYQAFGGTGFVNLQAIVVATELKR